MKALKKVVKYISNVLMICITIILVIISMYLYQTNVEKKDYANIFGYTFFYVITGSMSPTIEVGDIIIVKIDNDIKEDDIVVYKENNNFITHRIIRIDNEKIITKGDANNTEDSPIVVDNIIGKVKSIIPNFGIWRQVISSPQVLIPIVTTIVLIGLALSLKSKDSK